MGREKGEGEDGESRRTWKNGMVGREGGCIWEQGTRYFVVFKTLFYLSLYIFPYFKSTYLKSNKNFTHIQTLMAYLRFNTFYLNSLSSLYTIDLYNLHHFP